MNKRRFAATLFSAVAVAVALGGCGHKAVEDGAPEAVPGVTFQSKYGLLVPASTAKFIGLHVVDVEERKVAAALQFPAQVYREASEAQLASGSATNVPSALASGTLATAPAAMLRNGHPVTVAGAGVADPLPGRIAGVNRELEKASGQIEVLLSISDERAQLTRGALVTVSVALGGEKSVVAVPRSALLRTIEGDFIYTVSGERFVRAQVKLGVVNHEFAEVMDGLYAGDRIVVNPVMTLWMAELQSIRGGKACADGH